MAIDLEVLLARLCGVFLEAQLRVADAEVAIERGAVDGGRVEIERGREESARLRKR